MHSNNSLPPAWLAAAATNSLLYGPSAVCVALHAEGTLHMAAREKHPLLHEIQSLMRPASSRCRRRTHANRLLLPASEATHIDVSTTVIAPSASSDFECATSFSSAPELDCNSAAAYNRYKYRTVMATSDHVQDCGDSGFQKLRIGLWKNLVDVSVTSKSRIFLRRRCATGSS